MTHPTHTTTYPSGLTVENYSVRPADGGPSAPGSLGCYPTGFAGTGWLVRDADGQIMFASAWRIDALRFNLERDLSAAKAAQAYGREHPYAGYCGDDDALEDRIASLEAELASLAG